MKSGITTHNNNYDTIKRNDKFGIVDNFGKIVVQPVFDSIYIGKDFVEFTLNGYGTALWPIDRINEL